MAQSYCVFSTRTGAYYDLGGGSWRNLDFFQLDSLQDLIAMETSILPLCLNFYNRSCDRLIAQELVEFFSGCETREEIEVMSDYDNRWSKVCDDLEEGRLTWVGCRHDGYGLGEEKDFL